MGLFIVPLNLLCRYSAMIIMSRVGYIIITLPLVSDAGLVAS